MMGKLKRWQRIAISAVVIFAVFTLGVNVGNGRLVNISVAGNNIHFFRNHSANGALPAKLDYSSVDQVYQSLKSNYYSKLSESQLEEGLKHGLAQATGDPYTEYFTAKEAAEFESEVNNHFSGIGAELGLDKDNNLEVIAPIEGLPAAKAGLLPHDIIAAINGTSTAGSSVDEAVSKIRGHKGTSVKLDIVRNKTQTLTINVTRDDIKVPSVETKTLDNNIGYLRLRDFANDTADLSQHAAAQFKQNGVKAIILDLRNNGGGYLDAADSVSSLWLKQGQTIVETKGTSGDEVDHADGNNLLAGLPTVVLINGGSASASEITAGALHDNKDAYLIGEKSYGKGVVQQLINFKDGSQLKVTIASWYRPNGQSINKKGINPDKEVKMDASNIGGDQDTQLQAAEAYLQSH